MKGILRALSCIGAFALVASAGACSDPTSAAVGTPIAISPNFVQYHTTPNTQFTITAHLLDAELNSLNTQVAASVANAALVKTDSTVFVPEINETRFFFRAGTTTKIDSTAVTLTASGLTKNVEIVVSP
jgi:hypothetical protein